ncbi:hypothetical protein SH661x_002879 [Planctomicrobium sp. SH661]|uniref:hypothetical protein n=1 Tax=Planctomicrobium sp. SH661 TaxID=3448124 RepID=UPI003F5B8BFD
MTQKSKLQPEDVSPHNLLEALSDSRKIMFQRLKEVIGLVAEKYHPVIADALIHSASNPQTALMTRRRAIRLLRSTLVMPSPAGMMWAMQLLSDQDRILRQSTMSFVRALVRTEFEASQPDRPVRRKTRTPRYPHNEEF